MILKQKGIKKLKYVLIPSIIKHQKYVLTNETCKTVNVSKGIPSYKVTFF